MTEKSTKAADLSEPRNASTTGLPMEIVLQAGIRSQHRIRNAISVIPANFLSRAAFIPRCIAAGCGPCANTPASARAAESNRRYRYLLERGQTGLSVAFDLPTQIGMDSDHPLAQGEVGKVGVAIDSLEDMQTLFDGIPLDRVSTSMTINATAAILLALYVAVAKQQGANLRRLPARCRTTS